MSAFDKLALGPAAVNSTAHRVVKPAAPQNVWSPKPGPMPHHRISDVPLATAPIPRAAPAPMRELVGKRRGRMTIYGYAADQGGGVSAKWVARCDCGNYEHRTRILRWLHTQADDMCAECLVRRKLTHGIGDAAQPAKRADGGELQKLVSGKKP